MNRLILASVLVVAACKSGPEAVEPPSTTGLPPVEAAGLAAPAAAAPAAPTATYVGVVTTKQSRVVVAEFEGRLDKMIAHAGQPVHTGDEIARIDASQLQQSVLAIRGEEGRAKSSAAQAGISRAEAKRRLSVEKQLLAGGASTPEAVKQAEAQLRAASSAASAMYSAASSVSAERERMETLLEHATLKAPIDGVVSMIRVKEGEMAVPGTPIARIFDPADRQIRFAIPAAEQDEAIRAGAMVQVTVPSSIKGRPDTILVATVTSLSSVMEPGLQLIVVEADLDDTRQETQLAEVGKTVDVRRMP